MKGKQTHCKTCLSGLLPCKKTKKKQIQKRSKPKKNKLSVFWFFSIFKKKGFILKKIESNDEKLRKRGLSFGDNLETVDNCFLN
jgi:hypothetical protein